jgi:hypothetical protein
MKERRMKVHFRQDRKWKNVTQTESTPFSEALPSTGILDSIMVTARIYNASAAYDVVKPNIWDHISKLVVRSEGVESFKDMWGQTALAEYGVQYGKCPPGFLDTMSSNYQSLVFPIMFGRKWKDGSYGLDLSARGETRLEISNDWVTADLQATASIWYDIDLWFLENAPKPSKFIGTTQVSSNTWTANSQEKTFVVPKKYKVRRIFLGCESFRTAATGSQGNKAWRNLRYLTYSYKSGGTVVINNDDLYRSDQDNLWGFPDYVQVMKNCEPRTGYTEDVGLCRPVSVVAVPSYSADPGSDLELTIDQRSERLLAWRRADAGFQGRLIAGGYGFMDHLCIHEDQPDDETYYLDPNAMADVEVKVGNSSSGGTTGTIRFVTQHLRDN